jgi:hypothetical protein
MGLINGADLLVTNCMRQGKTCPEATLRKIVHLLRTTDLTYTDIAGRMGCSSSFVATINRRYAVRNYEGGHSTWQLVEEASVPRR